ncbi:MAG: hypothetical protein LUE86_08805 [Clostridiales bacterium]|nr:hypothetical protein [Clostridiales bacterium]
MRKYVYHLTTKENAKRILKEGLLPQCGEHSMLNGDTEKFIYLTDRKDIPYWKAIIGGDTILRIDQSAIDESKLERWEYPQYAEYLYTEKIPAEAVSKAYGAFSLDREKMADLCLSYLDSVSNLCVRFAQWVTYEDAEPGPLKERADTRGREVPLDAESLLFILKRLDFSAVDKKSLRRHLREAGEDGEYTVCDRYDVPGSRMRLYELLGKDSHATPETKEIYQLLVKAFGRRAVNYPPLNSCGV